MRLIPIPKSMEVIKEKLFNSWSKNLGQKYLQKSWMKNITAQDSRWFNPKKIAILMQIKSLQGMKTTQISSYSLEDWRDLTSLISSLKHEAHITPSKIKT
jgi:hypothetical protein